MSENEKTKSRTDVVATSAGAVGGGSTVAGIGYAVAGTNAATMTTFLAAVGSTVGGGMAAGILIVAAAPLAAGGLCYGGVKGYKLLKKKWQKKKNKI